MLLDSASTNSPIVPVRFDTSGVVISTPLSNSDNESLFPTCYTSLK